MSQLIYGINYTNKTEKIEFMTPCPLDDCRGFIDKNGLCHLCGAIVCTKCNEFIKKVPNILETQ